MQRKKASFLSVKLLSFSEATIDIATAYFAIDILGGWTLTWPMLALAWWVMDSVFTPRARRLLDNSQ